MIQRNEEKNLYFLMNFITELTASQCADLKHCAHYCNCEAFSEYTFEWHKQKRKRKLWCEMCQSAKCKQNDKYFREHTKTNEMN